MAPMAIRDEILELLRRDPAFREELRRQLLTEEVLALPRLVRELVDAQRRTEAQLQQLAEQVQRLAEQVQQQGEHLRRQGQQIQALADQVGALVSWQRGEAGRRDGERYERETIRRAPVLFNGGQGGSPDDPWVRQRMTEQLREQLDEAILPPLEDPFLADLVWWKGEQVAVVEVSLQVNGVDVTRAAARTATLARAGARALAVVIGDEWASTEAVRQAETLNVAWKVGPDLSSAFLALRRRPA